MKFHLREMKYILKIIIICACLLSPLKIASAEDSNYLKREAAVKENMKHARRLESLSAKIKMSRAGKCYHHDAPYIGAQFATEDSFSADYKKVMKKLYGVNSFPTVTMIADHSPAANALEIGDMIKAVNGKMLSENKQGLYSLQDQIKESNYQDIVLAINRGGKDVIVKIKPVKACNIPVRLGNPKKHCAMYEDGIIKFAKKCMRSTDKSIVSDIESAFMNAHIQNKN